MAAAAVVVVVVVVGGAAFRVPRVARTELGSTLSHQQLERDDVPHWNGTR